MLKNKAVLEVTIGDRKYEFVLPNESPIGEVFDALTQMRGYIVDRMVEEQNKNQKKESEISNEAV